jgi:lysozyme family protein
MDTDYQSFVSAFNHAMLEEVGPHWNPEDPDVIQGLMNTPQQKRKVGYVNHPQDPGGETKYGVAQKANPEILVRYLDLEGAMRIYYEKYWLKGRCDDMPFPLSAMHFDGCINHGVGRANKIIQEAVGVEDDGVIGNQTLSAINAADQQNIISSISSIRTEFYHEIVERKQSQQVFLNGWLGRISRVTDYSLSQLDQK